MKKIFFLIALLMFFDVDVMAKYVYPAGSTTTTERRVNRRIKRYDSNEDEKLTFEEYKKYREPKTFEERQLERRAKKKGTYISPAEAFKEMDTDGDGEVTREEMLEYEKAHQ